MFVKRVAAAAAVSLLLYSSAMALELLPEDQRGAPVDQPAPPPPPPPPQRKLPPPAKVYPEVPVPPGAHIPRPTAPPMPQPSPEDFARAVQQGEMVGVSLDECLVKRFEMVCLQNGKPQSVFVDNSQFKNNDEEKKALAKKNRELAGALRVALAEKAALVERLRGISVQVAEFERAAGDQPKITLDEAGTPELPPRTEEAGKSAAADRGGKMPAAPAFIPTLGMSYATDAPGKSLQGVITASSVYIRSTPESNGAVIGGATKGQQVRVVSREGKWLKIKMADGKTGYIFATFVDTKQ